MLRILALVFVIACTPATHQWSQTFAVGEMMTERGHFALVAQIEVAVGIHRSYEPQTRSQGEPFLVRSPRGEPSMIGIQATAGAAAIAGRKLGSAGEVLVGGDYLCLMTTKGLVGLGMQVGSATGAIHGLTEVAPRLWFQLEAAATPHASYQLGLMLRGQLWSIDGTALERSTSVKPTTGFGAGAMFVVSRVSR